MGIPFMAPLLGILLTVVGLGVATLVRGIELKGIGSLIGALVGLTLAGWAAAYLWTVTLTDNFDPLSRWGYAIVFGASFLTNTLGIGAASLVVSNLKIRGFFGLLAAGFVITVAEQSLVLIQLARLTFP
jgi:hypothetical protein